MQVLLVNARRSPYSGESISAPQLGLLSLASVLREGTFHDTAGTDVHFIDDQLFVLQRPLSTPSEFLRGYRPDIVGIQVLTSSLKNGIKLASEVRHRHPNALTVLGGVGASPIARKLIEENAADVVVRGEGEYSFSQLVHEFGKNGRKNFAKVRGITFRDDEGEVVETPAAPQVVNLDKLPKPARDLADLDLYRRISRGRSGNLVTSRGCSYACAYCYSKHQWGVGQRRHSAARVVDEIRELVEVYGFDRIRIEDDDFVEDVPRMQELCDGIAKSGLQGKFEWEAKARPDLINDDMARMLRESGCFRLLVGVETLSWNLLKRLGRPVKVDVTERAISCLTNNGIGVQATMILGIPGETDEAMRTTITWLQARLGKNKHDLVSPCFFVPFHQEVEKDMAKRVDFTVETSDTDCYTGHIPVTSSMGASIDELWKLYDDMTPSRSQGQYKRIAFLANLQTVQTRLGLLDGDGASNLSNEPAALVPEVQ
ncbi:B12-binding domain-containing radical SAM protein [Streptantibioticus cattleyicolor]|uniref:Putative methyltransferase n=2 Tax=Streptantibioticus cattleyicolor TaxID=29303 RepID=F8JNE4_STREN|nr:radical SAM protein [Streptantibioticus cattleyicolor]AEW99093.1 putative methyltransferase [Streptantibioticus cattleyicolor NRRL 8057 = DSM 46488]CAD18984.1 putative methyltransferase [Streptantibioticus cattleyicolor]CCB71861.1 putative methyltransferase [Streptantibioticus cattleyicolor NRRL 8057 = DSM 46488]